MKQEQNPLRLEKDKLANANYIKNAIALSKKCFGEKHILT